MTDMGDYICLGRLDIAMAYRIRNEASDRPLTADDRANIRRIVACLNLLDGHSTDKLEGKTLEQYVSEQAFLSGITTDNGINIGVKGLACQLLAGAFAGQFKGSGAVNYLEVTMEHQEIGEFIVTMQRNDGMTPHQFRIAAEGQRDELAAENARLRDHLAATRTSGARLEIKRHIAPSDKWHWSVILDGGHIWDVSTTFDSVEACAIDAAGAGVESLKKAEDACGVAGLAQSSAPAEAYLQRGLQHGDQILDAIERAIDAESSDLRAKK